MFRAMTRRQAMQGLAALGPAGRAAPAAGGPRPVPAAALERMQEQACTDMRAVHMVDGAGHWVQQEQPEETARLLIDFLRGQA